MRSRIDLRKVILAAVEAALEDMIPPPDQKKKRHRLPAKRAILLGAGVMTAVGIAGKGRWMVGTVGDRIADVRNRIGSDDDPDQQDFDDEDYQSERYEDDVYDDEVYEDDGDVDEGYGDEGGLEGDEDPAASGGPDESMSATRGRK